MPACQRKIQNAGAKCVYAQTYSHLFWYFKAPNTIFAPSGVKLTFFCKKMLDLRDGIYRAKKPAKSKKDLAGFFVPVLY
jgi:hypothetical protein